MLTTSVGRFRAIAFVEGISFLVLLLIAMPIKYLAGNPAPVFYIGWAHGVLFMLYAVAGFWALFARGWGVMAGVWGFIAAVVPAGTFVYDAKFLRDEERKEQSERATAGVVPRQT